MKTTQVANIRWMVRADLKSVVALEALSFPDPWPEKEFVRILRHKNVIGMVAERDKQVIGYMVYTLYKNHMEILNFAVHPGLRRKGVGRAMIERLVNKLRQQSRRFIEVIISERNMAGINFFRATGFRGTRVHRDLYDPPYHLDDGIEMRLFRENINDPTLPINRLPL